MIYLAQQHVSNNMTLSMATVALSYNTLKRGRTRGKVVAWKERDKGEEKRLSVKYMERFPRGMCDDGSRNLHSTLQYV